MKGFLYSLLLIIIISGNANAQTKGKAAPQKNDNSLLWKISGKGLTAPSYLFGTYHFAGKVFVDSLNYIDQKFKSCKAMAGEAIIDPSVYMKIMPMLMLPGNDSLNHIFSAAEYQLLADSIRKSLKTDISAYKRMKPAAVNIILTAAMAPKTSGEESNPPLDLYFQGEGKKLGMNVVGLETAEFQANLLLNQNMESQKRHLLSFVKRMSKARLFFEQLYSAYCRQDLQQLAKLMIEDEDYDQEEMDVMLKNRNLNWMTQLPALLSKQSTFVAVGAGHLVGEFGLINQLRLKGYTVTPVRN